MRSIPAAMTWELLDRGRWALPAAAIGSLAFPILILAALNADGAIDPQDRSMVLMHFIFVQFNALMFGGNLIGLQWKLSRHYSYPATTATLVAWRLLPAMALMAVETAAWTAAVNAMFGLDWPACGPALVSTVAVAAVAATIWLTERSRWVIFGLAVVNIVLGLWFKSRYGPLFGSPDHHWTTVTPADTLALAALAAASFWLAVVGVARNRRGEPPFTLGLVAWLDRLFDRAPAHERPFLSPAQAHFWFVARHRWLASIVVVLFIVVGAISWLFASRDPQDLVNGLVACVPMLMTAALVAAAEIGNVSSRPDLVMSQFLATRPMTPAEQARIALRAGAVSVLLAWAAWLVALAAACGGVAAFGAAPLRFPADVDWRLLPASAVGSWVVVACLIAAILTGHSRPIVPLFFASIAAFVGFMAFTTFALAPPVREQAMQALVAAVGLVLVGFTLWAFVAGRRRRLVDAPTAWAALAAWSALVILGVLMVRTYDAAPHSAYALLVGVLALAVAPLAAAPLAVAWNRHR